MIRPETLVCACWALIPIARTGNPRRVCKACERKIRSVRATEYNRTHPRSDGYGSQH